MLRRYPFVSSILFTSAVCFLVFAKSASGQANNPGTPSWSAYDSHLVDTVNLQNLNVMLTIPVMSKSGAFPFSAALAGGDSYMSYNGTIQPGILSQPITPVINGILSPFGYTQALASTQTSVTCPSGDGTGSATKYSGWYLQMTDGTVHSLPSADVVYGGASCSSTLTDQAIDGTGWTLTIKGGIYNAYTQTGVTVISSGGLSIDIGSATIQDAQSTPNTIYYLDQEFYDTLGIDALVVGANAPGQLNWFDRNGGNPTESQTLSDSTLKTSFGCTGKADYPATAGTFLTTAISFPDGSDMGFTWEPNGSDTTGRLQKLTLRSGGIVTYNYNPSSGSNDGLNCTYLIPNKMTRATSDGTTTYTWAASQISGSSWKNTTTVVDQGGNTTIYTFTGLTATGNAAAPVVQALTQVQHYLGASTLLATDVYCYNGLSGQPSNCATATVQEPITEIDVYHAIPNLAAGSSRTQTQYDGGPTGSCGTGHGGCYGNVTYSARYDFGSSTPLRSTAIKYGSCSSGCTGSSPTISAVGSSVNNKPGDVLTSQNGNPVAESRYTYNSHANLLTTYEWTGSLWLSNPTQNSYNSNGTPSVLYDMNGNYATYAYNSGSYIQCSGCSNFPFATSITREGLTTSSTWDGAGGVKLTQTDANGQSTTYGYVNSAGTADPFWRVSSVTDPLGNKVWTAYSPSGPIGPYIESSFAFGSSVDNEWNTVDGYGRQILHQKAQSSTGTNYDTVSTSYGWSGNYRSIAKSIPCSTTNDATCTSGIVTTLTDPLGRPYTVSDQDGGVTTTAFNQNDVLIQRSPAPSGENLKQVQNEYDGLGWLTSSCKISSTASGNVSCSQNTNMSFKGVVTTTSYSSASGSTKVSSARGSQTRSTTYDALGRVISTTDPESGTTTYTYDYYAPGECGGWTDQPGDLMLMTNGDGSVCYVHDGLHRLIRTGTSKTPNTCKSFAYDSVSNALQAQPSGSTFTNLAGRLVEAETDSCTPWPPTAASMITDEWFSYDADGHLTDMWELTPHSGMYYHSHATYAGNGAILSVQLENPSLYTETYGLDGEGRLSTLMSGTVPIVSGTTYNGASQPIYIDLGTGTDRSDYIYDPNTGRMTNWTFEVGSSESETGALTWNPNGTLKQLVITDGFNPGGSQTCDYNSSLATGTGYDDLGRLIGVSCGSVWAQSFSYDQYDNLTKSGSVSWNPGYNAANNQYSSGASYDGSGNLTYDTIHTYTWDGYNKLSSIDTADCTTGGECVIYDALGRMVESSYKGTYTEIWYTQLGKTAYMLNGNSIYYAYWPTPGGGTVEVNGNNVTAYYMHKDWLGSSRISSVIVNPAVVSDQAYAPYSEVYNKQSTGAAVPGQMFTGDTQDVVSGIFDTPNRELNSSQGRWLSPDPAGAGWNLYAYATNPNSLIDPTGLDVCKKASPACGGNSGGGSGGFSSTGDDDPDSLISQLLNGNGVFGTVGADSDTSSSGISRINGCGTGGTCLSDITASPLFVSPGASDYLNGIGQWFQSQACGGDCSFDPTPLLMVPGIGEAGALIEAVTDASELSEGAEGVVLSGHGMYDASNGMVTIPSGTTFTMPTDLGSSISDAYGGAIESGADLSRFTDEMTGARTYLSGSEAPNLTLYPPEGLIIQGNPTTVAIPTTLDELLSPNMGNVKWAGCCSINP